MFLIFFLSACQTSFLPSQQKPFANHLPLAPEEKEVNPPRLSQPQEETLQPISSEMPSETGSFWSDHLPEKATFSHQFFPRIGSQIKVKYEDQTLKFRVEDQTADRLRIRYQHMSPNKKELKTLWASLSLSDLIDQEAQWTDLFDLDLQKEHLPFSNLSLGHNEKLIWEDLFQPQEENDPKIEDLKKELQAEKAKVQESREFLEQQIQQLRAQPKGEVTP